MAVPDVTAGRGAWSAVGKDNKSRHYGYILGLPADGSSAGKDVNYQAVNLGVKAIQARINSFGYSPALILDGQLGLKSKAGIEWVQRRLSLHVDGIVGPATARALWRDYLYWFGGVRNVPAAHLYGFMSLESAADPGAVGYTTPSDRGLSQINLKAHPTVTVEQAFDPIFAIDFTAKRLAVARQTYSGKGVDLMTKCSIAQHNSPVAANKWYSTGSPPSDQIATYVRLVLENAARF